MKHPAPADFAVTPRLLAVCLIAIPVALLGVIAGYALLELIRLAINLAYFGRVSLADVPLSEAHPAPYWVAIPVLGSVVVGLMARFGSEKIRGHGIPEAIEAILLGRSRLGMRVALLKPLSSAISIGTGGPFGAEGPIIMTGGAIGSLLAQALPVSDHERKTLLVAGAAAGMTTVFGTPIAAIMLAVELLLFEWTPRSFVPVAVAAVVAAVARSYLPLAGPLFPMGATVPLVLSGLWMWVGIGVVSGLLSCALTHLVYGFEDAFTRLPIHWMWWPALGGLIVGIGGLIDPGALAVGYDNIAQMLSGQMLLGAALLLLVVKAVIWSAALGSGTSGGVLAPLLILGGALGTILGHLFHVPDVPVWALLGMAATMGGTMRSPLTATFFAAELTGNTHLLLPLIAACGAAHTVTLLLMRRSILTEKIARRGHHVFREYQVDPLAVTRVRDIMTTPVETVPATLSLRELMALLLRPSTQHPSYPVVDGKGKVIGIVDARLVLQWRRQRVSRQSRLGDLLAGATPTVAYPDEYIDRVLERMGESGSPQAAVIDRTTGSVEGYLVWRDLMRVRERMRRSAESRHVLRPLRTRRA